MNFSKFVRKSLLARTNYKNEELKQLQRDLVYQVRKIGVNVNQAAKRLNAGYGRRDEAGLILEEQKEVERLAYKVIEECNKRWESQS